MRGDRWTPGRLDLLCAIYQSDRHIREIVAAFNELPGERVSPQQAFDKARCLGMRRGSSARYSRQTPPLPIDAAPRFSRVGPIEATPALIATWAAQHGVRLATGDDMARVNRVRREHGLREFRIVRPAGEYVEA